MKRLASLLCTLLLVLLMLVPIVGWIMAAMGMSVSNLLCAEGFRWLSLHALGFLLPEGIGPFVAFIIAVGCVRGSGFFNVLRRTRRTVNERVGLIAATVVFAVLFAAFLVPVFKVDSELRSVTGQLYPSPWFTSIPFALSAIVFLSMLCFGLFASREKHYRLAGHLLTYGLSHYALWLIFLSLLSLLLEIIKYIFT